MVDDLYTAIIKICLEYWYAHVKHGNLTWQGQKGREEARRQTRTIRKIKKLLDMGGLKRTPKEIEWAKFVAGDEMWGLELGEDNIPEGEENEDQRADRDSAKP